ncbi:ribosomal protein S6 [Thermosinus carboxydivorans Nor1]|uniref:Small ribosomal subunit protein bS6 n=1 Tax=Thermosinus carboxydivorans Nor1 TaxID=401526 RepID=A1HSJ0_9FIRM|nr:30S ribosomal protein S6 [Thermosinus carboxydivorans]EAX46963.1 ribosomal protein S6 [Thermosinus carboxydivorans Nor1]
MRKYEVIFIVKPLDEEATNAVIAKFENLIKNNGGNVEKIDRWGKRRLAYPVKDFTEGYYCVIYFDAEPKAVFELERVMKITDEILRHMVVKEDE